MFSFDWIVLKKNHIKDNKILVSIFTKEYWKINAWITESKKRTGLDLWNVYNFSSKTENSINKIENIKAKIILKTESLDYFWINNILQILTYLEKILPNWVATESVYNDYIESTQFLIEKDMNYKIYVFFIMRLIKKTGIGKTPIVWIDKDNLVKIFWIILDYDIEKLIKIWWLERHDLDNINTYNSNTLINYIN